MSKEKEEVPGHKTKDPGTGEGAGRSASPGSKTRVFVATSVMLSFISFWRAAAIVLNDLGSSAYYVGGIAEHAVGHAAPWFILGVMLFSYAVRAVYVESCSMFTRGGVYRVVKEAMGGTLAKLSVSALMFDYILTGPISGVSAGQYIVRLVAQTMTHFGHRWAPSNTVINLWAAALAVIVTVYFWWRNTRGIHESSDDALRIMYVTTAMVVMLIAWCVFTFIDKPETRRLPPSPLPHHLTFDHDAVGWLPRIMPHALTEGSDKVPPAADTMPEEATPLPRYRLAPGYAWWIGLIGIMVAFGHSFLAMSGEESLAQVNRELEFPKHKNLMRAGFVIFIYSLLFTSLVSFFAYAIIPVAARPLYFDNLISGIAMYLSGPMTLKLLFQSFIVVVGFLMLSGAVNTAIIGANGVLNRVAEDGVLHQWFREPHPRHGTTYRLVNLIAVMQIVTIIGSRGNVYVLGEAYAFGVVWSFSFNALAMMVLRFHDKSPREWKVPLNIRLGKNEIPIGLGIVTFILFSVAGINMITKEVATISGVAFTLVFFILFMVSERMNESKTGKHVDLDHFQVSAKSEVNEQVLNVRSGNALCFVRDFHSLGHLSKALEITHTGKQDLVVMSVKFLSGPNTGYENLEKDLLFGSNKQELFTRVVALAEKQGKSVHLLVVPSSNYAEAIVLTASQLKSAEIILGAGTPTPQQLHSHLQKAWCKLAGDVRRPVRLRIIAADHTIHDFPLADLKPKAA